MCLQVIEHPDRWGRAKDGLKLAGILEFNSRIMCFWPNALSIREGMIAGVRGDLRGTEGRPLPAPQPIHLSRGHRLTHSLKFQYLCIHLSKCALPVP